MRAVLDPNVIISALLSPGGAPANVLSAWRDGHYELAVSPQLLDELERALAYPKLRRRIPAGNAAAVVAMIAAEATAEGDIPDPPARSRDPGDDYLIALAEARRAVLVSGDADLLELADRLPIFAPAAFLEWLARL